MWAIIPVKAFYFSKQRLAGSLDATQRALLSEAMLSDVLSALSQSRYIENTLVVSSDQSLRSYCECHGVDFLLESADIDGLNQAVDFAVDQVFEKGIADCLVLHGDLPSLTTDAINTVANELHGDRAEVLLLSDKSATGSNALCFSRQSRPVFCFGENSQSKHCQAASDSELSIRVLSIPEFMIDVDEREDLDILRHSATGNNTRNFVEEFLCNENARYQVVDSVDEYLLPSWKEALLLEDCEGKNLLKLASTLRDKTFTNVITYSRKVFFPLTHLCRDVCHYCTFAQTPKFIEQAYMPVDVVLEQAKQAKKQGCKEALFTLGEKPELRYQTAQQALDEMGFSSTLEYVAHVAKTVFESTGILPHINAGCMTADEMRMLKPVSASMGLMLESTSERLCQKGMPHYGSPDKEPAKRLQTLRLAGELKIPFTTGILIGIGETRKERIESLLAIREIHQRYGHIQEIIVQNFKAKENTLMVNAPEPDLNELLWTIAVARIIFGSDMSIQAPPNLSPGVLQQIVAAGINDWGGVSPLTPDFVNPEAPWPELDQLKQETLIAGKYLHERVTVYPSFINSTFIEKKVLAKVLAFVDGDGLVREDDWLTGTTDNIPELFKQGYKAQGHENVCDDIVDIIDRVHSGVLLSEEDIARLFKARGVDFSYVCQAADEVRKSINGENVSFTINRNINYTNICYFKCKFCAFSKGKLSDNLRGKPYDLSKEEIQRRVVEAYDRGASEVCMQGGIHPSYTGQTYIDLCSIVKEAVPQMHIHAFSPLEIWQGAATLDEDLETYLERLKDAGLASLPGTAAEVLDDDVREQLCADKINTAQWLEVMRTAHKLGIKSTATIMFGHIDDYTSWAKHLIAIRDLQRETGGFTEFVPLPFVASESPIYLRGESRLGPTLRESILMHAVARLVLSPWLENIQASWVKLGEEGVKLALNAGANDLGGTLMNESITRSAGAAHGEELDIDELEKIIRDMGRNAFYRTTLYQPLGKGHIERARQAEVLTFIELTDSTRVVHKNGLIKPGDSLSPKDKKVV